MADAPEDAAAPAPDAAPLPAGVTVAPPDVIISNLRSLTQQAEAAAASSGDGGAAWQAMSQTLGTALVVIGMTLASSGASRDAEEQGLSEEEDGDGASDAIFGYAERVVQTAMRDPQVLATERFEFLLELVERFEPAKRPWEDSH